VVHALRNRITHALHRGEEWIFANPRIVLGLVLLITVLFATCLPRLRVQSDFDDLLPQSHPYVKVYNRLKQNFGGANLVVMAIEVDQGTIFNPTTLKLIHEATQGIDNVPGVNHNLVSSLTHRTARKIFIDEQGTFTSRPYYDPQNPPADQEALKRLQQDVVANPAIYGLLVSPDLRAAVIRAQLNEADLDYPRTFAALQAVRQAASVPGHHVYLTGNPVLVGWVYTYLGQIMQILAVTLALICGLLVLYFRRLYGIALPLLGIALSTIWGLGFMALMKINLEPLSMPIPFLIAARATSHGVQLVVRYYEELAVVRNGKQAAVKVDVSSLIAEEATQRKPEPAPASVPTRVLGVKTEQVRVAQEPVRFRKSAPSACRSMRRGIFYGGVRKRAA